jgi:hypothetical protein
MRSRLRKVTRVIFVLALGCRFGWASDCKDPEDRTCRDVLVRERMPKIHPYNPEVACWGFDAACQSDARKYQEVLSTIEQAKGLDKEVHDAMDKLKMSQVGFVFDWTSWDSWKKRYYNGEEPKSPTAEADAAKALASARDKQYVLYNHAIAETIELYHLVPNAPYSYAHQDGSTPMRPWLPHFVSQEKRDEKGNSVPLDDEDKIKLWKEYGVAIPPGTQNVPNPITAVTDPKTDKIGIFSGAFFNQKTGKIAPNELALYILHETAHWLDFQILGHEPNPSDKFHSEIAAYQAELDVAARLGISDTKNFEIDLDRYKFQSEHAPLSYGELKGDPKYKNWAPASSVDVPDGSRFEEIDRLVDAAIEKTQKLAWIQQQDAQEAAERRQADLQLRYALRKTVMKACRSSRLGLQFELDALVQPSDRNFFLQDFPGGLGDAGSCEYLLYGELRRTVAYGVTLDEKYVKKRAASIRSERSASAVPPRAQSPQSALPAARSQDDIDRWTEYFEGQAQIMRDIVASACSTGQNLSSDDARQFEKAYDALNKQDDHSVLGHGPRSALNGLSGCELELMKKLQDADYDAGVDVASIRERNRPPSFSQPNRRPSQQPSEGCSYTYPGGGLPPIRACPKGQN